MSLGFRYPGLVDDGRRRITAYNVDKYDVVEMMRLTAPSAILGIEPDT
jgi:hypothetical protein